VIRALLTAVFALGLTLSSGAEEVWILQSGPEACDGIPVEPLQPVPAWRGQYSDGNDLLWVYVSNSPFFFPPTKTDSRTLDGTGWTAVAFFPSTWKSDRRQAWFDRWAADFQVLASLPAKGWPVLFPSVLRKG